MNKVKTLNGKVIPDWIVEEMLCEQERQCYKRDISIFSEKADATEEENGFDWLDSLKGYDYWNNIILDGIFPEPEPGSKPEQKEQNKEERMFTVIATSENLMTKGEAIEYAGNMISEYPDKSYTILEAVAQVYFETKIKYLKNEGNK